MPRIAPKKKWDDEEEEDDVCRLLFFFADLLHVVPVELSLHLLLQKPSPPIRKL